MTNNPLPPHPTNTDTLQIDICTTDPRWDSLALPHPLTETLQTAITLAYQNGNFMPPENAPPENTPHVELSVVLTNDAEIQELNNEYRGKNKPTNVLSFATYTDGDTPHIAGIPCMLGDIILAFDTIMAESKSANKTPHAHLTHLCIHGTLHLLGYDHITESDAQIMETLETELLATLNITDPYTPIAD